VANKCGNGSDIGDPRGRLGVELEMQGVVEEGHEAVGVDRSAVDEGHNAVDEACDTVDEGRPTVDEICEATDVDRGACNALDDGCKAIVEGCGDVDNGDVLAGNGVEDPRGILGVGLEKVRRG